MTSLSAPVQSRSTREFMFGEQVGAREEVLIDLQTQIRRWDMRPKKKSIWPAH